MLERKRDVSKENKLIRTLQDKITKLTTPPKILYLNRPFEQTTSKVKKIEKVIPVPMSYPVFAAVTANVISYLSRKEGFYPFDGYDKISDVGGAMGEPAQITHIAKLGFNAGVAGINKLLKRDDKDIFYYNSFTKKELITAIVWYGTLWATSEITGINKYNPVSSWSTADLSDIPAYIVGLSVQYKSGKEAIKRFPPGRFDDMERSVDKMLRKAKSKGELSSPATKQAFEQSLQPGPTQKEATKQFLSEYKTVCQAIQMDLRKRTRDIRGYIKDDPALVSDYNALIQSYTFALSRKWFVDEMLSWEDQQSVTMRKVHAVVFDRRIVRTQQIATKYRERQFLEKKKK